MTSLFRFSFAIAAIATASTHAAIVGPGDGTQNTTAPIGIPTVADTPAFDNIGRYRVGSAIYLGNRWMISAEHVHGGIDTDPITFTEGGTQYFQETPGFQLRYPGPGGGTTDLALFRLSADPGLPQLQIGATPTAGTPIVMAGYGRNRATDPTRWNANTNPWSVVQNGGNQLGYLYGPGTTKRWATNVIQALGQNGSVTTEVDTESYLGKAVVIGADFTRTQGTPFEGILANGDSGGGAFANNRLIGMPVYLDVFENQPAQTAVYGNLSYFANLASYADQIATITGLNPSTAGDANLDGLVNTSDFEILRQNFGQSAGWTKGDFNIDGLIDFADFQILERNFTGGTLPPNAAEILRAVSVPEPTTSAILFIGCALLTRRRR